MSHTATTPVARLPLKLIDPPAFNARHEPSEAELVDLSESICDVGLIQAVVVRPIGERFEIVCGERRRRAALYAGLQELPCIVHNLDDLQAAEFGLLENRDRKQLNAIEEAGGLRQLLSLGHTKESLAEITRMTAEAIDGTLGLLGLPSLWQDRVEDGLLSAAAAEYLIPWAEFPAVLEDIDRSFQKWPMPLTSWRAALVQAVSRNSRSMEPTDPAGPLFDPTPKELESLQVRELRVSPRLILKRAMNVEAFDRLAADTEIQPAEPVGESEWADSNGNVDARQVATSALSATAAPPRKPELSDAEFGLLLAEWKGDWLEGEIVAHLKRLPSDALAAAATTLTVDLQAGWTWQASFLDLFGGERLQALADELGLDVSDARDDREIRSVIEHVNCRQIPAALIGG